MNFCTLFDCNYLDRALVLVDSLEKSQKDYHLFAFLFDDISYDVFENLKNKNITIIPIDFFLDDRLKKAKLNRSAREFLWTCSSYSILYVLNNYDVPDCTYIDADMYFYNDCSKIYVDFLDSGCDAAIIPHNFYKSFENKCLEKKCGRFCVEFNTFKNNSEGLKILKWWVDSCIDLCTEVPDGTHFGDQKYLDEMIDIFDNVYIYSEEGMGIAPWNVSNYVLDNDGMIKNRITQNKCELYFYHFHSLSVESDFASINLYIRTGKKDTKLIKCLYEDYIIKILDYRNKLNMPAKMSNKKSFMKKIYEIYYNELNLILFFQKCFYILFYGKKDKILFKEMNRLNLIEK